MKHSKIERSRFLLPLLALVISAGSMHAAGIVVKVLGVDATTAGIDVSCSLQSATPGPNKPVVVTLTSSPASAVTIATNVAGTSPSVATQNVAGAVGTTLGSTTTTGQIIYNTGVTYNINAKAFCANVTATGSTTATLIFTGTGGLTSGNIPVRITAPPVAITTTATPQTLTYNCSTSNATPTAQTLTAVLSAAPLAGSSVVYSATAFTSGGAPNASSPLVVSVPATAQTPAAFAGVTVSVNALP